MARIFTKENIKLIAFLSINVTIKQSSKKNTSLNLLNYDICISNKYFMSTQYVKPFLVKKNLSLKI